MRCPASRARTNRLKSQDQQAAPGARQPGLPLGPGLATPTHPQLVHRILSAAQVAVATIRSAGSAGAFSTCPDSRKAEEGRVGTGLGQTPASLTTTFLPVFYGEGSAQFHGNSCAAHAAAPAARATQMSTRG